VAYTAEKPKLVPDSQELRARIPGWGVDLNPSDRPGIPRERFDPSATGAHWDFPERQPDRWGREHSNEHKFLTPVFGTSTPPRGLSGMIRRFAYRYSEGQTAHWMLLMLGDRIDVLEARAEALMKGRPDNPLTETGLASELKQNPITARFGRRRADTTHTILDPIMFAAPYAAVGFGLLLAARGLRRR
jgi:hypothetical protein